MDRLCNTEHGIVFSPVTEQLLSGAEQVEYGVVLLQGQLMHHDHANPQPQALRLVNTIP